MALCHWLFFGGFCSFGFFPGAASLSKHFDGFLCCVFAKPFWREKSVPGSFSFLGRSLSCFSLASRRGRSITCFLRFPLLLSLSEPGWARKKIRLTIPSYGNGG